MQKAKIEFATFIINTICTLKCKNCITRTPYQRNPQNYPLKSINRDMDLLFDIFEHLNHVDFEGGETLLHPDLPGLVDHALYYVKKGLADEARILTNGTLLPSRELLTACKQGKFLFIVDDYGPALSVKKDEVLQMLNDNGIAYRVDTYYGDNQYYGGWIDFGNLQDKGSSQEELLERVHHCHSAQAKPYVKDGKVFTCGLQASGMDGIPLVRGEYIDLYDDCMSLEEKIRIGNSFGKQPIEHCRYCNGFIVSSKRISAAKQLEKITEDMKNCGQWKKKC